MNKFRLLAAVSCLSLMGCAEGRQRSLVSRKLDSGITSSNGGGELALHNIPNVEVTNGVTTVTGIRERPTSPCNTNPHAAGC